jgi:catechol 2,3-dioxygenase-like lactoylglutathione lyase family enzyme
MDWKLAVVPMPVTDVARAVEFYRDKAGFAVTVDIRLGEGRMVQLTPPGSGCAIQLGVAGPIPPGAVQGMQLVVSDIRAARAELVGRGVDVSPVRHFENGAMVDGPGGEWNSFLFFQDPDGNGWTVQEGPHP